VDADVLLRRIERTAILACLSMSVVALLLARGRPGPAIAVIAGGLLIGASYWTIGSGVSALVVLLTRGGGEPARPPRMLWIVAKVALRYALLGFLAYVMIARLHLHPLGLLAGASSVVSAAAIEAVRLLLKKS
jgi:hypothetical protein